MHTTPPATHSAEDGVVLTFYPGSGRSSTSAARAIVGQALEVYDSHQASQAQQDQQWRRSYPLHIRRLVEGALVSPDLAIPSAFAGLKATWDQVRWKDPEGEHSLNTLFTSVLSELPQDVEGLQTVTVKGGRAGQRPEPFLLPYKGQLLKGDAIRRQVEAWAAKGVIEDTAAEALTRCVQNPDWFDLSDRTMVLLGAGSEAGPLRFLAQRRANIVAVDRPVPSLWKRLAAVMGQSNGTLHAPMRRQGDWSTDWTDLAGADLLKDTLALAAWVRRMPGPLDVAAHAYADGERHVRVVAAMDFIQAVACEANPNTSLAFMATPTDVFAVPLVAAVASMENYDGRSLLTRILQGLLAALSGGRFFQPNIRELLAAGGAGAYGVVDSLIVQQGPNYALAKRVQQWRALVARKAGHRVSINIAPSSKTASVLSNPALAAGFLAADIFGVEVFEPSTTNALMAALWVHDLRNPVAKAAPGVPLNHPLDLIADSACHGGLWRVRYLPRSALPFVAGIGWLRGRMGPTSA